MKKLLVLAMFVMLAAVSAGCYWNEQVNTNQVAAQVEGGAIVKVVPSGLYSGGINADLIQINCDALNVPYENASVATAENQSVAIKATIIVLRDCGTYGGGSPSEANVKELLTNWNKVALDDAELSATVVASAGQGVKAGVHEYTLEQLLADRNGLAAKIEAALNENLKFPVRVVSVQVNDVDPDASYMTILQEKANLKAQTDTELQRQALIRQSAANAKLDQDQRVLVSQAQLAAEQAKTAVEVEIAKRDGEVIARKFEVYKTNPAALELRRLELLQNVIGNKATFWFLQPDQVVNLFTGQTGGLTPVVPASGQ